jgi:hypothetical protein
MRIFINILLCCIFLTNCKGQDPDFKTYINSFGQSKIPLLINDRQSSYAVFCQRPDTLLGMMPKVIKENIVAKYICTNGFCNPDGGYFRYDYGVKIDLNSDFISVLVSKLQYEGDSDWDFDLGETLLIIYNNNGEIRSRQFLTKDNIRWQSSLEITKEGIAVMQIKVTEPEIDQYHHDLRCEFWTTRYQVTDDGIIKPTETSTISTGLLVWDKSKEDYKLKE